MTLKYLQFQSSILQIVFQLPLFLTDMWQFEMQIFNSNVLFSHEDRSNPEQSNFSPKEAQGNVFIHLEHPWVEVQAVKPHTFCVAGTSQAIPIRQH